MARTARKGRREARRPDATNRELAPPKPTSQSLQVILYQKTPHAASIQIMVPRVSQSHSSMRRIILLTPRRGRRGGQRAPRHPPTVGVITADPATNTVQQILSPFASHKTPTDSRRAKRRISDSTKAFRADSSRTATNRSPSRRSKGFPMTSYPAAETFPAES